MPKEVMRRTSLDNKYVPKFFHGEFSAQLEYIAGRYGHEGVRRYLRQFTQSFHAPLIDDLRKRGLIALKEYFEEIYRSEEADLDAALHDDAELVVKVRECPAVRYMKEHNLPIYQMYYETAKTVGEALCEDTPYASELAEYDSNTGRSVQRFCRRRS